MDLGRLACIKNFEKFRKFSYKRFAHKSARYLSRYSEQRPSAAKALGDITEAACFALFAPALFDRRVLFEVNLSKKSESQSYRSIIRREV
jgi:hypothetical protein